MLSVSLGAFCIRPPIGIFIALRNVFQFIFVGISTALKKQVYILSDNIVSPLGVTTKENFDAIASGVSGVRQVSLAGLVPESLFASAFDRSKLNHLFHDYSIPATFTFFEQACILSVLKSIEGIDSKWLASEKTIFILSTTKGNIDLAGKDGNNFPEDRLRLQPTATAISGYFKNPNAPLVVSNACISGVVAVITAKRLLATGVYNRAVVIGADLLTPFVASGFRSFNALANGICQPFDKNREGINLGEAVCTMILTTEPNPGSNNIEVLGGGISNDANHISGPSRTGDGLLASIEKCLKSSKLNNSDIGFISGHGTATLYNDEMESLAIESAQLSNIPLNSLKRFYGHTLGAAGVLESVISCESMRQGKFIATHNIIEVGVTGKVYIPLNNISGNFNTCLKTAAGFGGCNAAVAFKKVNA